MMMSSGPEMLATGSAGGMEGGRKEEKKGERVERKKKGREEGGRVDWDNLVPQCPRKKYIPQNSMSCSESKFWPIRF